MGRGTICNKQVCDSGESWAICGQRGREGEREKEREREGERERWKEGEGEGRGREREGEGEEEEGGEGVEGTVGIRGQFMFSL